MTIQSMKNWRAKSLNFTEEYKKDKSCSCCGYSEHPEILQFHHLRDKSFCIAQSGNHPLEMVKKEVKKCVLLCPNCHFLLHYKLRGTL